jgi:hypothetical protein
VTDFQGTTANVQKGLIQIDDNKSAHPIDKVLYSDQYYPDFVTLCSQRKLTLSDFCKAVVYADLSSTINAKDFANTVFVPNNKAFTKQELGAGKVPTVAQVQDVVKFHVVPGVKVRPSVVLRQCCAVRSCLQYYQATVQPSTAGSAPQWVVLWYCSFADQSHTG